MRAGSCERGFTLMELIIVLAMLAAFAAMAVPLAGRLEARGRERETQQRLELLREALLGPRGAFDAGGRRVLAGYAGGLGGLPPLRRSVWKNDQQRWEWPGEDFAGPEEAAAYWASGMGQPRNLWAPLPDTDPLAARWRERGPYLHEPRDELPANAEHLRWSSGGILTEAQRAANREIEMRQTAGRLADAWGRSLLFFYVAPGELFQGVVTAQTTVYIVSEGPDMQSSPPAYRRELPGNGDNLVLIITPPERDDEARREETRRLLRSAADALVGRFGPADRRGRPVFGGFVGDQGLWPALYVWQGTPAPWRRTTAADVDGQGAVYGQPRGLWTRDTDGNGVIDDPVDLLPLPPDPAAAGSVLLGFGWRGPYLPPPEGTGANELLRDAWGVPLQFRLSHAAEADPPPEQTLTIISAGPDGTLGTADDLTETVPRRFDVRQSITLEGKVVNETAEDLRLRVRLYASPAFWPAVPHAGPEPPPPEPPQLVPGQGLGDNTWQFSLPVPRSSAGPRLLELFSEEGGVFRRWDWTTVYISSGGTATPEREPLVLRAR